MHIFCTFFIRRSVCAPIKAKNRLKIAETHLKTKQTAFIIFKKTKKKTRETVSLESTKPVPIPTKTNARG